MGNFEGGVLAPLLFLFSFTFCFISRSLSSAFDLIFRCLFVFSTSPYFFVSYLSRPLLSYFPLIFSHCLVFGFWFGPLFSVLLGVLWPFFSFSCAIF